MLPLQVLVSWQILYLGVVSFFLNTFRLDEKFGRPFRQFQPPGLGGLFIAVLGPYLSSLIKLSLKQWVHPYHYNSGWDFDWIPFKQNRKLRWRMVSKLFRLVVFFFFRGGLWGEEIGTGGVMGRFNQIPNHSTLEATVAILFLQVLLFWVAWTLVVSQARAFQPSLRQEVVSLEGQPCFTATWQWFPFHYSSWGVSCRSSNPLKNPLSKQGGMRSSSSFPSVIKDNTGRSAGRSCSCNLQCQTPEKKYSLQQSNEAKSLHGRVGSCRISDMKSMNFSKVVSQFTSHFPQPCTSFHDDAKCFWTLSKEKDNKLSRSTGEVPGNPRSHVFHWNGGFF